MTSDHRSLEQLEDSKINSGRLARILEQLSEFDFKIQYKEGTSSIISVADALSRLPRYRKIQEDGKDEPIALYELLGLNTTQDYSNNTQQEPRGVEPPLGLLKQEKQDTSLNITPGSENTRNTKTKDAETTSNLEVSVLSVTTGSPTNSNHTRTTIPNTVEWGASILTTDPQLLKDITEGYEADPYFLNIVDHLKKKNDKNHTIYTKGYEIFTVTLRVG